jgi:hypothetical protein
MKRFFAGGWVALAVLVSGCAGTAVLPAPTTLERVNAQLADRPARIVLASEGSRTLAVRGVVVGVVSTTFTGRLSGEPSSIPTALVAQVLVLERPGGGGKTGALIGTLPGLLIVGYGAFDYARSKARGTADWGSIALWLGAAIGLPTAIAGMGAGALIGYAIEGQREREVYRGPVERYGSTPPEG